MHKFCGAWVICEPWFTGSRDLCELWKYVNHKSKFTEKSCEPGSQKFGSRTILKNFYSNNREPNFCEPIFCEPKFFVEKNLSYINSNLLVFQRLRD